jgi:hypothetical protein
LDGEVRINVDQRNGLSAHVVKPVTENERARTCCLPGAPSQVASLLFAERHLLLVRTYFHCSDEAKRAHGQTYAFALPCFRSAR